MIIKLKSIFGENLLWVAFGCHNWFWAKKADPNILVAIAELCLSFCIFDAITGISDVNEAYQAAIKGVTAESHTGAPKTSVQDKSKAFSEHLKADQTTAIRKIQDGMQFLAHVVLSTSMSAAWIPIFLFCK